MALLNLGRSAANSDDPFRLANFLNEGGKVILYHGGSDSLITPFRSRSFAEQLRYAAGAA